jgi:hypothetical protein
VYGCHTAAWPRQCTLHGLTCGSTLRIARTRWADLARRCMAAESNAGLDVGQCRNRAGKGVASAAPFPMRRLPPNRVADYRRRPTPPATHARRQGARGIVGAVATHGAALDGPGRYVIGITLRQLSACLTDKRYSGRSALNCPSRSGATRTTGQRIMPAHESEPHKVTACSIACYRAAGSPTRDDLVQRCHFGDREGK